MSKDAAMRAMREARYAERAKGSTAASRPASPAIRPPEARTGTSRRTDGQAADSVAPATAADGLCGHRSMNGRTCTRELGHEAKSHRYS